MILDDSIAPHQEANGSPYLAEVGKGVLLTAAKVTILEDRIGDETRALRDLILKSSAEVTAAEKRHLDALAGQLREAQKLQQEASSAIRSHTTNTVIDGSREVMKRLGDSGNSIASQIKEIRKELLGKTQDVHTELAAVEQRIDKRIDSLRSEVVGLEQRFTAQLKQLRQWIVLLVVATPLLLGVVFYLLARIMDKLGA